MCRNLMDLFLFYDGQNKKKKNQELYITDHDHQIERVSFHSSYIPSFGKL